MRMLTNPPMQRTRGAGSIDRPVALQFNVSSPDHGGR